ncbi:hypothetical protein DM01DRAFT_1403839 [Hesseltinella vesiculosa]|uniref:Homoserine dehydrogenase n=1 Tax=Hesseltinella vesiculosa TaxID=101127 RepID=A0A1X2GVR9_9FUNG|nr:hypothetical protein DM01DRAFT_1403839 [Hesseltinella vesiculosa]
MLRTTLTSLSQGLLPRRLYSSAAPSRFLNDFMATQEKGPVQVSIETKIMASLEPTILETVNESHLHAHHSAMKGNTNKETHFKVTVVSEKFQGKPLVQRHRMIHALLGDELKQDMVNIGIVGTGLVGSELIQQLKATGAKRLNVVGLTTSRKMLLSDTSYQSLDLGSWPSALQQGVDADLGVFAKYLSESQDHSIIVDCTASDGVAANYPAWLQLGLSVVTPNKKGFSGTLDLYQSIRSLAGNLNGTGKAPFAYYESTVGAGLPVLNTLADLVNTGDKVHKVEGIFSGTLSYLFNNFSSLTGGNGKSFSENVKVAKELGYTEPDPRDDLNGMDVARKVTICGRLAGVDLDLTTLPVENIVPGPLQTVATADEFMAKLPEYDAHFAQLNEEAKKEGQVLRCVGLVDVQGGQSGVKLLKYPGSHPFASLQGSDNIIKFTTEYFPNGLIIQGAGAGAAVTSFGIFSDILKVQGRVE